MFADPTYTHFSNSQPQEVSYPPNVISSPSPHSSSWDQRSSFTMYVNKSLFLFYFKAVMEGMMQLTNNTLRGIPKYS